MQRQSASGIDVGGSRAVGAADDAPPNIASIGMRPAAKNDPNDKMVEPRDAVDVRYFP